MEKHGKHRGGGLNLNDICISAAAVHQSAGQNYIVSGLQAQHPGGFPDGIGEHGFHGIVDPAKHGGYAPGEVQLAPYLFRGGHADDVHRAAEAADHAGGPSGKRIHNDTFCIYIDGHGAGGVGYGIQIVADLHIHCLESLFVMDGLLGCLDGPDHGLQSLQRILSGSGLAGQHDSRGSVINRIRYVGNLSPGGTGLLDHGLQHLRCSDHAGAQHAAFCDETLLDGRNLVGRDLHAQVAAGDHDAVCDLADLINVIYAGAILDLGNDVHVLSAVLVQEGPKGLHILLVGNKGCGHILDPLLDAEQKVRLVLLTEEDLV